MTAAILKALDWPNGQLSSVIQLDSHEALCVDWLFHHCLMLQINIS